MTMIISRIFILVIVIAISNYGQNLTKYADPFIGTGGTAHTFPGATLPFGMVQLSPDTDNSGWNWCSGYNSIDSSIMGFSHTHFSGTGRGDLGDILFMPTVGKLKFEPGNKDNPDTGYRSRYSKNNENASPGFYKVFLDDYYVTAELTVTERVGFHKYTFPKTDSANIIIDLGHGIRDKSIETEITFIGDNKINGFRRSKGWAPDHTLYFVMEFSKPFKSFGTKKDANIELNSKTSRGKVVKGFVTYRTSDQESVMVKVGISAVSVEGAELNLNSEIPDWDFEGTKKKANKIWNDALSKIVVEGGTKEQKTIFYTALYHSMIHPNVYSDVDGKYIGMDKEIHTSDGRGYYHVFSLWDTYRALHPLLTIIKPQLNEDFVEGFISKYFAQTKVLPKWTFASYETNGMMGYHSVPVIYDAYKKGNDDFDVEKAFEAMKITAELNHLGLEFYKKNGFVAADLVKRRSVSKTLEYAYDDWCIAMMAKDLGYNEDYQRYKKRSLSYKNVFNSETCFMQARTSDGNWTPFFNPYEVTRHYTEANSWQYSFYVPHDVHGLLNLFGGQEKLNASLDKMFVDDIRVGFGYGDISGLMGQYAHGNEPSHHMAYLYNYTGEPWKTQTLTRDIMEKMYSTGRDGLIGNDDCGQLSAWYVFSAMGFYPVCPGTNEYVIGSPIFDKVTISTDSGEKFTLTSTNNSDTNKYIQSVKLNGMDYTKNFITHSDIIEGANIEFEMGSEPNKLLGLKEQDLPYSLTEKDFLSPPFLKDDITFFDDSASVNLTCRNGKADIFYTIDGSEPDSNSLKYIKPFYIFQTTIIKAISYNKGFDPSPIMTTIPQLLNYKDGEILNNSTNGLKYNYYEGTINSVFDIKNLEVSNSGILDNFYFSPAQIENHFAFIYEGFLKIEEDEFYKFYVQSDDGSALYIDGKEIVRNDGPHGIIEASGAIALKVGYHPIKLLYFQDGSVKFLKLFYKSRKMKKTIIPEKLLFY